MRIPSPAHLRIGTDIIKRNRLYNDFIHKPERLLRLTKRLLRANELAFLSKRFPGWQDISTQPQANQNHIASWLAGRWAAKEAAKKAWGAHLLSFRDLRVEVGESGEVQIICLPHHEGDASQHGTVLEQAGSLSISHDGEYAIATVLAAPLHPDIESELGRQTREAEGRPK